MSIIKKLRFIGIVLKPKYTIRKMLKKIITIFLGSAIVAVWVSLLAYYLAWIIISNNTKKEIKQLLKNKINNNTNDVIQITSFDKIKVSGFPLNIDISIDKITFKTDFVDQIEVHDVKLRYFILNQEKIELKDMGDIIIVPIKNSNSYVLKYNSVPKIIITKNKNDVLEKINYQDNGHRIINAKSGKITDNIGKTSIYYERIFDIIKNKFVYQVNLETQIQLDKASCKECDAINNLEEIFVKLSMGGEDSKENNKEVNSVTINNFSIKSPAFVINGYGSILNNDKNTFKITINLNPYLEIMQFITNYLLNKKDLFINKTDIGRYYIAIDNKIIPRLVHKKEDNLKLYITKDKEGDIEINKVSLDYILSVLYAEKYSSIY
jgi:hypothetical protein